MAEKISMPQLGESVTEGTITKWLVQPGDKVKKYEPLAEVMTDKVNAEVPSMFDGTIQELVAKEDETVAVGELICYIEAAGAASGEPEAKPESPVESGAMPESKKEQTGENRYSPVVLKLAQQYQIDLSAIEGSGRNGRVTKKDVEAVRQNPSPKTSQQEPEKKEQNAPTVKSSPEKTAAGDVEIPVAGVRKAIAANMSKSKSEIPHAWTMVEVDVTNLVHYRNNMKESFKQSEGYSITFLPFFIQAVAEALKEFPALNAYWKEDKIIQKKDINISIAAATEEALYVPVIQHADEKNIKGLAKEVASISDKVKKGTLSGEDMRGGTFTVNNTGSFGSIQSAPIINQPQVAILSIESIVKRPVVMPGDMIAIRHMVNLCLSLDHRALDGLVCGRFLQSVKNKLEQISL